jgi:predicted RNA binding protein YcfA (HicA-like mRNA interferase family)
MAVSRTGNREARLRASPGNWRARDAVWILSRHGFLRRDVASGHLVYVHPVSRVVAVFSCHRDVLGREIVRHLLRQIDSSELILQSRSGEVDR